MKGLSCFTANLHAYLDVEWDADSILARSNYLAARIDERGKPDAFSHHRPSLDLLPDGSRLSYSGADDWPAAAAQIEAELSRWGRAVVMVDGAALPWSIPREADDVVPHWVLVDGIANGRWHLSDAFEALLPVGEQPPGEAWVEPESLASPFAVSRGTSERAVMRAAMAFGAPRTLPMHAAVWLSRKGSHGDVAGGDLDEDGWIRGHVAVCRYLAEQVRADGLDVSYLDDLWAAAGHRVFSLAWQHKQATRLVAGWARLPRVLRFAAESTARGRPRDELILAAFTGLAELELEEAQ